MRKLRIKNKRQFKKAILTIIMTISIIAGAIIYSNYLQIRGFSSFFTTNVYKEAFKETSKVDIAVINFFTGIFIGSTIITSYNLLAEFQAEEQELKILKREEKNICG